MEDLTEAVAEDRLDGIGLLLIDGLGLVDKDGLCHALGYLAGVDAHHGLVVTQHPQVVTGLALFALGVLIVDLLRQTVGGAAGSVDAGILVQGLVHPVCQRHKIGLQQLGRNAGELGPQVLGEVIGSGVHLLGIHLGTGGGLGGGQALLPGLTQLHLKGVVILGPLGCLALAADAVQRPVIGDVVGDLLIGVADNAGADAAEAVAAIVAGVGHLLDDVILHGEGLLLHGADVLLIQGLRRLDLILHGADQCAVLGVLAIHQEAEIKGQQAQGFHLIGAGIGKVHVQSVVAAQILVDIEEAGALHHEGVDLLDGGIGVAALALPLSVGVDDAVQRLRQKDQGADDQAGVGVLILDIVPQIHGQRQQDTGAGTAGGRGDDNGTHGLLHLLTALAEQVVHSVQQRADAAGLNGGVQGQTGDGPDLSGTLGHRLVVQDGVLGKPVVQCVCIVIQIVAHRLSVGRLDGVDVAPAAGHAGQIVDIGVQTDKVDVLPFAGAAHLRHTPDDAASGAANTHKQSRGVDHIFLDAFLCHVATSESFYIWFVSLLFAEFQCYAQAHGDGDAGAVQHLTADVAGPVVADLRGGRLFGAHQLAGGGVTVKHQRAHLDGTNGAAVDGGHHRDLGLAVSGTGPAVVHRLQLQHHAALGQRIGRILGGCDGEASLLLAAAGELRAGRTGHRRSSHGEVGLGYPDLPGQHLHPHEQQEQHQQQDGQRNDGDAYPLWILGQLQFLLRCDLIRLAVFIRSGGLHRDPPKAVCGTLLR